VDVPRFELANLCAQEQRLILKGFLLGLKAASDYTGNKSKDATATAFDATGISCTVTSNVVLNLSPFGGPESSLHQALR